MHYSVVAPVEDRVCTGGECAETCPVVNVGGRCPSTLEVLAWFRTVGARVD